ncbi:MAG: hypothetical protein IPM96_08480 [Ignavibacteria bacterium]|nr:hypothetical protein [Ignavibacteria bacterium]
MGASVLTETMLVYADNGNDADNNEFNIAPDARNIIPDENCIAIGLDENTAVIINQGYRITVACEGIVYIFDGSRIKFANVKDTAFNICTSIMTKGYEYDLKNRVKIVRKRK